jgi:hypothetical protein
VASPTLKVTCHCVEGRICEAHPDEPWPHDACPGPGTACLNPACPWWRGLAPAALNTDDWTIFASRRREKGVVTRCLASTRCQLRPSGEFVDYPLEIFRPLHDGDLAEGGISLKSLTRLKAKQARDHWIANCLSPSTRIPFLVKASEPLSFSPARRDSENSRVRHCLDDPDQVDPGCLQRADDSRATVVLPSHCEDYFPVPVDLPTVGRHVDCGLDLGSILGLAGLSKSSYHCHWDVETWSVIYAAGGCVV